MSDPASGHPTTAGRLLVDAIQRVNEVVHQAVEGAAQEDLVARLDPAANSMAWLVWHVARIQDDHVAGVAGRDQVWLRAGWAARFDLPFDVRAVGYGQSASEVAAVQSSADLLLGYADAVHEQSLDVLRAVSEQDLARVVDERWDPPVTMAVRLVSVISDNLQHAGQAAFIRGVLGRRTGRSAP